MVELSHTCMYYCISVDLLTMIKIIKVLSKLRLFQSDVQAMKEKPMMKVNLPLCTTVTYSPLDEPSTWFTAVMFVVPLHT